MIKLYLASTSQSRRNLLKQSKIKFELLKQSSDENIPQEGLSLEEIVTQIAFHKMERVVLPVGNEGEQILVLVADTLGLDNKGRVCGKPKSKEDAISMIKSYRNGAITGTAFCLDKKEFRNGEWVLKNRVLDYAQAEYVFDIPDDLIEWYLEDGLEMDYMSLSGAIGIDGAGAQFLKSLNGSYSAVLGLPLYEFRMALIKITKF